MTVISPDRAFYLPKGAECRSPVPYVYTRPYFAKNGPFSSKFSAKLCRSAQRQNTTFPYPTQAKNPRNSHPATFFELFAAEKRVLYMAGCVEYMQAALRKQLKLETSIRQHKIKRPFHLLTRLLCTGPIFGLQRTTSCPAGPYYRLSQSGLVFLKRLGCYLNGAPHKRPFPQGANSDPKAAICASDSLYVPKRVLLRLKQRPPSQNSLF